MSDIVPPAVEPDEEADAPVNETKADKFRRLGRKRVPAVFNALRLVGNLSAYEYTDAQVNKIEADLTEALENTMALFRPKIKTKKEYDL